MDVVIASAHIPCLKPGTREENTQAYLNVIKNPYVNVIGHPDDSRYPFDREKVVMAAKEAGVAIELNNSSLSPMSFREHARNNHIELRELCKSYEVPIVLGSDAHEATYIMDFSLEEELLKEVAFLEDLFLNTSAEKWIAFVQAKKDRL